MSTHDLDALKKRLRQSESRRPMLELELLLEKFLAAELDGFDQSKCESLSNLLVYPDADILDWLGGLKKPPAEVDEQMLKLMAEYWPRSEG
uniref:FAD assembly factor SdhE n=1 Tax=Magnetococcus massalia (strain MO-1) TaxID=451514 RepID=A0A1S7LFT8_MAGMO|nr:conserved protein of unknown function [Candidatus Magnetococcus massalia]